MKDNLIRGTNHFCDRSYAYDYYANYGCRKDEVDIKIHNGEINIGTPDIKPTEKLFLNKSEGRYFIGAK